MVSCISIGVVHLIVSDRRELPCALWDHTKELSHEGAMVGHSRSRRDQQGEGEELHSVVRGVPGKGGRGAAHTRLLLHQKPLGSLLSPSQRSKVLCMELMQALGRICVANGLWIARVVNCSKTAWWYRLHYYYIRREIKAPIKERLGNSCSGGPETARISEAAI